MKTTTTTTTAADTIVAIDLGKYKSVACRHDPATAECDFVTFATTRAELAQLVRTARPTVIIIEACLLAGWVHDLCAELGIRRPSTQGDTSPDLRVEDFAASCGDQGAHCRPLDPVSLSQLPGRKDMNR